ncbi:uncharacterized protein LOC107830014 isoform X2 [Nicotiana tabacum]|uniref:Uncharacterized protein LOC107830014 isoform X2 n=1 Tax=Nicotiana tabacum TaxID=4097 RepID=A0AC58TKG5_TOBAC
MGSVVLMLDSALSMQILIPAQVDRDLLLVRCPETQGFSSGLIIPEKYPEETTTRRQSYNLRSVLDPNDLMISRAKKNLRGQILRSMMMMRRRRIVGSQGTYLFHNGSYKIISFVHQRFDRYLLALLKDDGSDGVLYVL